MQGIYVDFDGTSFRKCHLLCSYAGIQHTYASISVLAPVQLGCLYDALFVAVTVGYYAFDNGAGQIGAIGAASLAGAAALFLGQLVFATIRSPIIRLMHGVLYALPAGLAGFHAGKGLSEDNGASMT